MDADMDFHDAARRIRQTSYPQEETFAAVNVLAPPAEEATLAVFAPRASGG